MFTVNNPDDDEYFDLRGRLADDSRVRYCVYQLEEGDSGTLHYQGYIELFAATILRTVKAIIGGNPHVERRRGTRDEAREYAMKEDTRVDGPWETGTWRSSGVGSRTDLTTACEVVATDGMTACALAHPTTFVKYHRGLGAYQQRVQSVDMPNLRPVQVILLIGPTGTGKTFDSYEDYPDCYVKPDGGSWFDQYEGQETVLIDDFSGGESQTPLPYLLKILDGYRMLLPVKGAFVHKLYSRVILTTNVHPFNWYNWHGREAQYPALQRRFSGSHFGSMVVHCPSRDVRVECDELFWDVGDVSSWTS